MSRRSQYSKNGCYECKRRKIKCDEKSPVCWQCSRLNKECRYSLCQRKEEKGTIGFIEEKPESNDNLLKEVRLSPLKSRQEPRVFKSKPKSKPKLLKPNPPSPPISFDASFTQTDLSLLANDLNNIVADIFFLSNYTPSPGFHPKISAKPNLNQFAKNLPPDYIHASSGQEKIYLEEFYEEFCCVILPFQPYDKDLDTYYNPARDLILHSASKESFLLAAVLAQGAKSAFNKNSLAEDEAMYYAYLSKCLKLLGPALENNPVTTNIESVLLTVLLLTSSNAANTEQNWRPHLRGAKDLLCRAPQKASAILVFCKFWFISIEVLAGLSSNFGGTAKNEELDKIITCGDGYEIEVLKLLGLVLENGFNLIGGYHYECVLQLREVIKILNDFREEKPPVSTKRCIELISNLYDQGQIEFFSKNGILRFSEFRTLPKGRLLDLINDNVVSWMDVSHQSYVLASLIVVLTKCLRVPSTSVQVQQVTARLISLVSFLGHTETTQLIKCSAMMIQWPMMVAGMNCVEEDHKFLVMKFFRTAAGMGSGSAGFALRKICEKWKQGDEMVSDVDIVSY